MILAIMQARMSSSRLPGKVLRPILGVPMLLRQIERISRSAKIDNLVVATSVAPSDNEIEQLCRSNGVECFRGSLDDVLDRFYQAAIQFPAEHIVRLTADCPLADPALIDRVIQFYEAGNFDYASNAIEPTFPDGLDVEIFRSACLRDAWIEATLPSEREHVTPFIHQRPERYKIGHYKNTTDLSFLRWTVDEEADFQLVTQIYKHFYPNIPNFGTDDILHFLDQNPHLKTINTQFRRNEGMKKSLLEDAAFLRHITTD
jgi:spore coat polysaccharide biosynthesis protein SpsF